MEPIVIAGAAGVVALLLIAFMLLRSRKSASPEGSSHSAPRAASGSIDSYPAGKLSIFFGSQTGTAEGFATVLASEGRKHGFDAKALDLEDFEESEMIETQNALFIMATYGEGEPTDNALQFVNWLKSHDNPEALSGMNYCVFGLGNTQYEHFNSTGKAVDTGLEKLSATRILPIGLGDDDKAIDEDFENWKEQMWAEVLARFHPDAGAGGGAAVVEELSMPEPKYRVRPCRNGTKAKPAKDVSASTKTYWTAEMAVVKVNRELRSPSDGGSTRHMEIDIDGTHLSYQTADNLGVLPVNDDASVERLARSQGYELDLTFDLQPLDGAKAVFPTPCTVREAIGMYCDIHSVPRRGVLKELAPFATSADERKKLLLLASKDGRQMFADEIERTGTDLCELIVDVFPSIQVPLEHFFAIVPHLHARLYTISSSSTVHPTSIHITVSVLAEKKTGGRLHYGVCSNFLQQRDPGTQQALCRIFVRDSTFRLPADPATPVILIGPGTGIAPMRALLQERNWQKMQGLPVGPTVLFFGCKHPDQDYLYQDELEQYQASGVLTDLHLAFSRQTSKKVYVQHLMQREATAKELWRLVDGLGAYAYVCGGTKMGADVAKVLHDIVAKYGKRSPAAATAYVDELKVQHRYIQELWS